MDMMTNRTTRTGSARAQIRGLLAMVITTLRGLRHQLRRVSTTAFAVMLGVAFTAGTLVLTDTLRESFDGMRADMYAGIDFAVRHESSFGSGVDAVRSRIDATVVEQIRSVPGVRAAYGQTTGWAQLSGPDGALLGDVASGVDPVGENWIVDPELTRWRIVDGLPPAGSDQVMLDRAAARSLAVGVGDRVDVVALGGTRSMQISGLATFGDADERFGTVTVLFDDSTAQLLLGEEGRHDRIVVGVIPGADPGSVAPAALSRVGASAGATPYEAVTGAELTDEARAVHLEDWGFFDILMKGFAVVALVVGGFIIVNTFSIIVAQRTREFALLRATGASRGQVLGSVLTEAAGVGLVASLLGLAGGVAVSSGLRLMFVGFGLDLPDEGMVIRASSLVVAFVLGVLVTVVSALVPALKASRTPPIAALRSTAIDTSSGSRARIAIGSFVVLVGSVALGAGLAGVGDDPIALVGLGGLAVFGGVAALGPVLVRPVGRVIGGPLAAARGVPGALARDNATRSPKRTAATAAALMIGVALVAVITVLAASVRTSIDDMVAGGVRADIVVESGSFGLGGLDRSLVAELNQLPEVAAVSGIAPGTAAIGDDVIELVGVDSVGFDRVLDMSVTEGAFDRGDGRGLGLDRFGVDADEAAARGWSIGSVVPVTLSDGVERELVVGAIFDDPPISLPLVVDTALLEAAGERPFDLQVFVSLPDGVDIERGLAAVATVAAAFPNAEVLDRAEFASYRAALVDPLLGVIYALLAFVVLIATLGIANTLALSIMERTRELGVLRAVGATRSQVRSMVRWESVMIASLGTLLGLAIGVGFGWAVVRALEDEGVRSLTIPVGSLATVAVLAAAVGVLAAVVPARRAARLDVLTALRS